MLETGFKVFFVLVFFVIAYKLIFSGARGLKVFEMHFKEGKLNKHSGKIPERFSRECKSIAKHEKLTCTIRAEKLNGVRLHISANVDDKISQRIRNVFPFEYYDKKQPDNSKLKG